MRACFIAAAALLWSLSFSPARAAPPRQPVAPPAPANPAAAAGPGWSYRLRLRQVLDRARLAAGLPAEGGDVIPPLWPATPPIGSGGTVAAATAVAVALAAGGPAAPAPAGEVQHVLLLGSDRRPGEGSWRTDTIVLVSVDRATRAVGMLSIPRDLWVSIPGYGQGRINTADYLGEAAGLPDGELIKSVVRDNLGVPVDRFVRVNFQALVKAVDTLGGIDLVVDCPLEDYFLDDGVAGPGEVSLGVGVHHVDGATALRYARSRHSTSDFDRSRRQRRVMRAMMAEAREKGLLRAAPGMLLAMREHVQTDLGLPELVALGLLAGRLSDLNVRAGGLDFQQLRDWTTPEGAMVLLADPAAVAARMDEVLRGPVADAGPGGSIALVDHTGRDGWDQVAGTLLAERRLPVTQLRLGAASPGSRVYAEEEHASLAAAVAEALGLPDESRADLAALPPALRLGTDVQVELGEDWAPACP